MKNYFEDIDREAIRAHADRLMDYAGGAKDNVVKWTGFAVEKAHGFSLLDYTVFWVCLTSFGAWVGTCLAKYTKKLQGVLFAMFAASWLYLFWRVFFTDDEA